MACAYANASDGAGRAAGVSSGQSGIFDCDDGYANTPPSGLGKPNPNGLHGKAFNLVGFRVARDSVKPGK